MSTDFVRYKARGAFTAVVRKLPTEWQSAVNSLLESVAWRYELEDFVSGNGDLISHTELQDIGTNTHSQIDTHIADTTVHYEQSDIDHTAIQNIGVNTHAQVDAHLAHNTGHPNQVVNATEPADGNLSINEGAFWYELV